MRGFVVGIAAFLAIAILVGVSVGSAYNRLIALNEDINGKWAQVENQLQRRYDLIPNLVSTVKGYAAHEEKVIGDVVEARAKLAGGGLTPEQRIAAAGQLEGALARLLVVVEQYPALKADAQFAKLMDELTGTENRLTTERMRYNESVRQFNETVKKFPMMLFAGMFGFKEKPYFQIETGAAQAPKVTF
ncbi:MAG: LemA family protein [Firmicutes bacterium]|nr:LemA family protein [Bacillota bacterium]